MIPQTVQYEGLEIEPRRMAWYRYFEGPYPATWEHVVIRDAGFDTFRLKDWVLRNTHGRFGIVMSYPVCVVYFEDFNDAVLFQLLDGSEEYCKKEEHV